jgi:DNA polymerase III epsilon subunit-like protein
VKKGHRIIEIGGVVMNGRKKTSETFHVYVNPQREIEKEAQEVHGISNEDLKDKPIFSEIAEDLLEFIDGSILVIFSISAIRKPSSIEKSILAEKLTRPNASIFRFETLPITLLRTSSTALSISLASTSYSLDTKYSRLL